MPSITNPQWLLEADMIMMLSGSNVYLEVPACATSQQKTRQLQSWNGMSECVCAVWKQIRAETRFTKWPTLSFNKMGWFGQLRAWSSQGLTVLQTWWASGSAHPYTHAHTPTHTHSLCRGLLHVPKSGAHTEGLSPNIIMKYVTLLLFFLSGRGWQWITYSWIP